MQRYSFPSLLARALPGNSGRNTQVTHSNYFHAVRSSFYDHSLRLAGPSLTAPQTTVKSTIYSEFFCPIDGKVHG